MQSICTVMYMLYTSAIISSNAISLKEIPIPFFSKLPSLNLSDFLNAKVYDGDVRFIIYSRKVPGQILQLGNDSSISKFDVRRKTVFLIHGWKGNQHSLAEIKDAYIKSKDKYNVIVVDWSIPASMDYISSVLKVNTVGTIVSKLMNYLVDKGLNVKNINIVGYSLGAHVAGIAAYRATCGKIGKVTGLDPAGPLFHILPSSLKLDITDAEFVQIIHTNGGTQGYFLPVGHVNFYPNGGLRQEGCGVDLTGTCSHRRSVQYYTESINAPVPFVGKQCSGWLLYMIGLCSMNPSNIMGEFTSRDARGQYYLDTNGYPPFARG